MYKQMYINAYLYTHMCIYAYICICMCKYFHLYHLRINTHM